MKELFLYTICMCSQSYIFAYYYLQSQSLVAISIRSAKSARAVVAGGEADYIYIL